MGDVYPYLDIVSWFPRGYGAGAGVSLCNCVSFLEFTKSFNPSISLANPCGVERYDCVLV